MDSKYHPRPQRRASELTRCHVAPASDERYTPPLALDGLVSAPGIGGPPTRATAEPLSSTTAQSIFGLLGATAMPILPTNSSSGKPPPSCFQVSPPSMDL